MQISTKSSENIAVTGRNINTFKTFIDVFAPRYSDSEMTSDLLYSREFEEYMSEGRVYWYRYVSVVNAGCTIVTCIGDKLEIIDVSDDKVLRCRSLDGEARCMSVREGEIFIGFKESNKVMVYDITLLHEMRVVVLQGIQDGLDGPFDMTVISDKLFVCIGRDSPESYHRSLVFQEQNGKVLSELTHTSSRRFYAYSITADLKSGVIAVVWLEKYFLGGKTKIVFYSLSENIAFLTAEIESSFLRIRISDGADKMIMGNHMTGEVNVYDMAELFTYDHLKNHIATNLKTDDFVKLTNFFCLPKHKTDTILCSDAPFENFFCAIEEMCVILPSDVDRLTEAFIELKTPCGQITEIYQRTRTSSYYKENIKRLREQMNTLHDENLRMKNELDKLVNRAEDADSKMQNLQTLCRESEEILRKAGIQLQHTNLTSTFRPGQIQQCMLKLLNLQRQVQLSTKSYCGLDKSLTQAKTLLQNQCQERYVINAGQDHIHSKSYNSTTTQGEAHGRESYGHTETHKAISLVVSSCADSTAPSNSDERLPESSLEDEFSKLLVKVSVKLTNTHCVLLANYFNFPASKIDLVQKDSETPGITLFRVMKERDIINKYDVTNLQEALVDLELKDIDQTLLKPYQIKIDSSCYNMHNIDKQEKKKTDGQIAI